MSQLVYAAGINSSIGALPATAFVGTPTIQPGDIVVVGAIVHGGTPIISGSATGKVVASNQWVWGSAGTALNDLVGSSKYHTIWWCTAPPTGTYCITIGPSATGTMYAQMAQFRPTPGYKFIYDPGLQKEYNNNVSTGAGTVTAVPNFSATWGTGNLIVMSIGCTWESVGTCVPGVGSLIQGTAMDANGKTAGEVQWGCTLGLGYSMNVPGTSGPYVLTMNVLTTTGGDSVGFAMVPALPEPNEPIAGETGDLMSMTSAVNRGSFW